MKRILLIISLFLLYTIGARAQMQLILEHRAWADTTFAEPEAMDGQTLLSHASQVIASNLQEESAFRLLEFLGTTLPEVADYAALYRTGAVDALYGHGIAALRAIADYADRQYPGSTAAYRCRVRYLNGIGGITDTREEMDATIARMEKKINASSSVAERAILCNLHIISLLTRLGYADIDDPSLYPEIFRLEKEALAIYPLESDEVSMDRAELYASLANLKNLPTNDFVAFIEHSASGAIPGMHYMMSGENRYFPNNSRQYWLKAIEVGRQALNEGHPWVQDMIHNELCFRIYFLNPEEDTLEEKRRYYNYVKLYYPADSFEVANMRIDNFNHTLRFGLPDTDGFFVDGAMDTMRQYLGATHISYLRNVANMAMATMLSDPEDNEWLLRFLDDSKAAGYSEESDHTLYYQVQLYTNLCQYHNIGMEDINRLTDLYLRIHRPSLQSVQTGRWLAHFHFNHSANNVLASRLMETAIADLSDLTKKDKSYTLLKWDCLTDYAGIRTKADSRRADEIYGGLLADLDKENFPQRELVGTLTRSLWADYKSLSFDYEGGYQLARQTLGPLSHDPDKLVYNISIMARLGQMTGNHDEEIRREATRAMEIIDCVMEEGYYGQINFPSLSSLVLYYETEQKYAEARHLVETQIKMYESLYTNNFTLEYIDLKQRLALQYRNMGLLVEASRIAAEATEMVENALGSAPSPQFLECLWTDYYATKTGQIDNFGAESARLTRIGATTMALIEASGNDPNLYFTYLPSYLGEAISMYYEFHSIRDELPEYVKQLPADQQAAMDQMIENGLASYNQLIPMAETLLEAFRDHDPQYVRSFDYRNLAMGLAQHYANVEGDAIKALQLRESLLEGITEPYDRFSTLLAIAGDYYFAGDIEHAEELLARATDMRGRLDIADNNDNQRLNYLNFNLALAREDYNGALPYARDIFSREKAALDGNFRLMTTAEQNLYINQHGDPAYTLATLLEFIPGEINGEVYNALVYRTGMQLRSQKATREAIRRADDLAVVQLLDSLAGLQEAMTRIDLSPDFLNWDDYNRRTGEHRVLQQRVNRLEQELLDATAHLRLEDVADVDWTQVASRLSPDEAAIEFLFSASRVMALVVRKDSDRPVAVNLCFQDDLWQKLHPARIGNSAALAKHLYNSSDPELYEMLWSPLEGSLEGVKRVFISTPGILSNIAFNAFATPDGRTLFDAYELVQLTTTAQLAFDHPQKRPETIAIMGDILYSPTQKPSPLLAPGKRDVDMDFSFDYEEEGQRAVAGNYFRHLPFTATEMEEISALFPEGAVDSVRRHDATETRLHEMIARRPDVIHLATHGYYVAWADKVERHPFFRKKGMGSMERSGFALSGAEQAWRGLSDAPFAEDGIVTASEVADFDLKATGLVALSACETALGDFSFEGVFGLQRGFKQAGVQSLLVSLWSVNDDSTALFMTRFYECLLGGDSRQNAWRNAVESVREAYPEPYFWAPFILLDGI